MCLKMLIYTKFKKKSSHNAMRWKQFTAGRMCMHFSFDNINQNKSILIWRKMKTIHNVSMIHLVPITSTACVIYPRQIEMQREDCLVSVSGVSRIGGWVSASDPLSFQIISWYIRDRCRRRFQSYIGKI